MGHSTEQPVQSWSPYYDPETRSVCFEAHPRGIPVKAFVTLDWFRQRVGHEVPDGPGLMDAYIEHAREIEIEVARRYAQGRSEPVWLASTFQPDDL